MRAPERIETDRLILRRPRASDAAAVYERYARDPEVTRFLSWPTHRSIGETRAYLAFSETEWQRWPAGPYLITSRSDQWILGSTGLSFETSYRAATGYVIARDSWGLGYATEALGAMVDVARLVGVVRLYALCHTQHHASARVLEKCGFCLEGTLRRHTTFPNLSPGDPGDVRCYGLIIE
jgi:[ribosomal protein S5]-alanine N-acetyltransferase